MRHGNPFRVSGPASTPAERAEPVEAERLAKVSTERNQSSELANTIRLTSPAMIFDGLRFMNTSTNAPKTPTTDIPEGMTEVEASSAAAIIDRSLGTLYALARAGTIPHTREKRWSDSRPVYRFKVGDLRAYLATRVEGRGKYDRAWVKARREALQAQRRAEAAEPDPLKVQTSARWIGKMERQETQERQEAEALARLVEKVEQAKRALQSPPTVPDVPTVPTTTPTTTQAPKPANTSPDRIHIPRPAVWFTQTRREAPSPTPRPTPRPTPDPTPRLPSGV